MHTHHISNARQQTSRRTFPKRSLVVAGAVLSSVVGLSAFAGTASAGEFYPIPGSSMASSCNGTKGVNAITLTNTGTDTAHFTIQWNLDWTSGVDFVDVDPGVPVTKTYTPLEGHYSSYDVSAPGSPPWISHAGTYTDCAPSPVGVITLVCPSDGSSAYLKYVYNNHSTVALLYEFGYPDGTTSSEQVDNLSGDPIRTMPVAEDTLVDGFIKAGGQPLWSFSQQVDCLPPIPATTIPETTIPDTTIPVTTIPVTIPDTSPPTTVVAVVPPVIEQLPPTVPPTTAFVPGATQLPSTGSSSGLVAILASSMLALGTALLGIAVRRRPHSDHAN